MRNNSSSLASYPDDELVLQAQARNPEAFEELMRRTNRSAFKLALSILRDRQEAEDEVQNSYLKAWSYVGQFQRESKFSTWISRIVVNQCLMRIRKFRGASFVYLDEPHPDENSRPFEVMDSTLTPEARLSGNELTSLLQREIRRLPPLLQTVLVLRDVDELTTVEVAGRLGISSGAVKSRLLRARSELRDRMQRALHNDSLGYCSE